MVWITHSVYVEMCRPSTCRGEGGRGAGGEGRREAGEGVRAARRGTARRGVLVEGGDRRRVRKQLAWWGRGGGVRGEGGAGGAEGARAPSWVAFSDEGARPREELHQRREGVGLPLGRVEEGGRGERRRRLEQLVESARMYWIASLGPPANSSRRASTSAAPRLELRDLLLERLLVELVDQLELLLRDDPRRLERRPRHLRRQHRVVGERALLDPLAELCTVKRQPLRLRRGVIVAAPLAGTPAHGGG